MDEFKKVYHLPTNEVIDLLTTHEKEGLSAKEVELRLKKYGKNKIKTKPQRSLWLIFFDQFLSPLVYVLIAAALLSFIFHEWIEGIAILFVILINAAIGFFMEREAVISLKALEKLDQNFCKVIRNNRLQMLNSEELVPGDLISLEGGDMIPADTRIIHSAGLSVNEASLTGESAAIQKTTDMLGQELGMADRKNLAYKGTLVVHGHAEALVFATGSETEIGKIALLTSIAEKESTPLEKRLGKLSQKLIWITFLLAAIIVVFGLLRGNSLYFMAETAIALAVAAIPEGLPIVATIALAKGMLRLAKKKVLVKRLNAVETLGETDVVFTDKTGTLTTNQLTAVYLELEGEEIDLREQQIEDQLYKRSLRDLLEVGALCNNASWDESKDFQVGDPLEVALLELARAANININELSSKYSRQHEIAFDSQSKRMATFHNSGRKENYRICVKGAVESVLTLCDKNMTPDGKIQPLNEEYWLDKTEKLAEKGIRVLAFAEGKRGEKDFEDISGLDFLGMIGFADPLRSGIKAAVKTCHRAGVKVIMMTGDHKTTAKTIAVEAGIIEKEGVILDGKELAEITEAADGLESIEKCRVFARLDPGQKMHLIEHYESSDHIVAMTGDGVNDAPALKKADIGIAMGVKGTDVAKQVADMILKNDAFETIVIAIKQGRGIFENIRHFVVYLLSCNLSEILVVALAFLANWPAPLLPLQILFMNMVTDIFPALALGLNEAPKDIMNRPPRPKNESLITRQLWISILGYSLMLTLATLAALWYGYYYLGLSAELANNFAFYTLILAQVWNLFNLPRGKYSFIHNEVTCNRFVWIAIVLCIGTVLMAYYLPFLNEVLSLKDFKLIWVTPILVLSVAPVFIVQILKKLKFIV